MAYLIAYDVADPKRLARVARRLQRVAQRVQKSVFLFRGDAATLRRVMEALRPLVRRDVDTVEAWALQRRPAGGLDLPGERGVRPVVRLNLPRPREARAVVVTARGGAGDQAAEPGGRGVYYVLPHTRREAGVRRA